jgi:type I restriction enzyme S subunit
MTQPDLPSGWVWTTFGKIFSIQGGSQPPKKIFIYEPRDGYVRLLQIRDFGDKPVPTYIPIEKATRFCKKTDILIARYGASLGRIVTGMEGSYNVALAKVIFDEKNMHSGWVYYLLQTPIFQTPIHMISRSAQNGFNKGDINPIRIPLPPLPEQQRIVDEIEAQFTRLDAVVTVLKRARATLKRYRASVLKTACEGRLVPQDPTDEPAAQLLEHILAERAKRNSVSARNRVSEQAPSPPLGRTEGGTLPDLPVGWVWATINANRKTFPLKLPYLRVANVYANELRLDDVQEIGVLENELRRIMLKRGDLLVVEGNGSIDQIGRVAIWDGSISPCVHQNHIIKVRFEPVELGKYILFWLLSNDGRDHIMRVASSTSGLHTLSLSKVAALAIPLPPLAEQQRIVEEVERRLSVMDEVEATFAANLKRAERLRQAILKRAFEGKLVPQNPADEPASVLLARIRRSRNSVFSKNRVSIPGRCRLRKEKLKAEHYYHIYNRGVNYQPIFFHPKNWGFFIKRLRDYCQPDLVNIIAYCLMPNHYHLLVFLKADEFGETIMQPLTVSYTKAINRQEKRVGPLFQGPFKAILVDKDAYLLHLTRYIHLNPVAAGLVKGPTEWVYSSFRDYIGQRNGTLPQPEIVLAQFASPLDYRDFVESPENDYKQLIAHLLIDE